jgi:hypothetical protein
MERGVIFFWIFSFLLSPKNKSKALEIVFFDRLKSILFEYRPRVLLHEKIVFSADGRCQEGERI